MCIFIPMNQQQIIQNTISFVKETLKNAEGGHDWFHIERVYNTAMRMAEGEAVNPLIVALGALLHDIADAKFHEGDERMAPKMAREFLIGQGISEAIIQEVVYIIKHISYKNSLEDKPVTISKEMAIIQDADRLDAMGAVGIARAFNYGGFKNRALYDPSIPPDLHMSKEAYKKSVSPTINHFYEKLLLLKDKMLTEKGRQLAAERHAFMELFLKQFYKEWKGEI